MMNRINRALAVLLASIALTGCVDQQEQAEPTGDHLYNRDA